jgi:hypothetical protein
MRFLLVFAAVLTCTVSANASVTLAEALRDPALQCKITGSGHGVVQVAIENRGDGAMTIDQPAGLICASLAGDARVITLRAAQIVVAAKGAADATIPAAALSTRNEGKLQPFAVTPDTEPKLAPFLAWLAKNNDAPRMTAQVAVLCVMEDVNFAQWQQFLAPQRVPSSAAPTPAEIAAAVDALGVLRTLEPERKFALAADGELRLRALRNPWSRAKAAQLFGIPDPAGDGVAPTPPDLGTLLHTKANDNCPICRQRGLMQPREDGP